MSIGAGGWRTGIRRRTEPVDGGETPDQKKEGKEEKRVRDPNRRGKS